MKKIYFVTLLIHEKGSLLPNLVSNMIDDAESESEALGIATIQEDVGPSRILAGYSIEDFIFNPSEDSTDWEHRVDLARESFLNLLEICSTTVMQKVHTLLVETNCNDEDRLDRLPNKIPAIKLLREHLKPFIGLKGCKEIVDLWAEQITCECFKTSLITLVREKLVHQVDRFA